MHVLASLGHAWHTMARLVWYCTYVHTYTYVDSSLMAWQGVGNVMILHLKIQAACNSLDLLSNGQHILRCPQLKVFETRVGGESSMHIRMYTYTYLYYY